MNELNKNELMEVDGGLILASSTLKKFGIAGIAVWVMENWADIKAGAIDGWNENH